MSPRVRSFSSWRRALLAALLTAACGETTGLEEPLVGRLSIRSVFAAGESATALRLTVDSIRVVITRTPADTVAETRAAFLDGQALSWVFELDAESEPLNARVDLRGGGELLYMATATLSPAMDLSGGIEVHDVVVHYVGAPRAMAIALAEESTTLTARGASRDLSATALDAAGQPLAGKVLTWSSSDPSIATVDAAGRVTAVANGVALIRARVDGLERGATVTVAIVAAPERSTLETSPASAPADGSTAASILVRLLDANDHPLDASGGVVALSSTLGTLSAVVDHGDGTYSASLTSTTAGVATVHATLDGAAIAGEPTVEFTPLPPVVTTLEITTETATTLSALGATQQYAAIAYDQYGAAMNGVTMAWTSSAPHVASIDASGGLATAIANGNTTITVSVNGVTASAHLGVAQVASAAHSTISADPLSLLADGTSPSTIVVTLRDVLGQALATSGGSVQFTTSLGTLSSVADHGDGRYSATLTSTTVGTAVVHATLDGTLLAGAPAIEFTPLPPVPTTLEITTTAVSALDALGATRQYATIVRDQYDALMAGVAIVWTSSAPTVASIDATSGLATAISNGSTTITATVIGASQVTASTSLSVAQVASVAHSTIDATPASVPADGATASTIIVTIRDARGHALDSGAGVVGLVSDHGVLSAVTDRGDGTYAATLTSPTPGTAIVHATLGGAPIADEATIGFTKLPSVLTTIEISPAATVLTALGATQPFSAVVRDQYGEVVIGIDLSWSSDAPAIVSIDANTGLATALANGVTTIRATAPGGAGINGSTSISVAVVADPARTTLAASAALLPADTATSATITVRLFDARGNALVHSGGAVSLQSTIGVVSPVTDHGDGTYSATIASGDVGVAHITGAVNGDAIGDTTQVEFFSIVPVLTTIEVTPASVGLGALGATHQYAALGRDQFGATMDGLAFVWESTDPQVATIDAATGLATAASNGLTTIRATASGWAGISGSAALTVSQVASASSSTLAATPVALLADGVATATVVVTLRDARDHALTSSGGAVTLGSSRGTLSSVTDLGDGTYRATLTSSTVGLATITGAIGATPLTATATVEFLPVLTSIVVTPGSSSLGAIGATQQFTAVALDATGVPMPEVTITWSTSDPTVASIDGTNGLATALQEGITTIRAASGSIKGEITLTVEQVVAEVQVSPSHIELSALGATAAFSASLFDALHVPMTGRTVAWSSSDESVATVDANGQVTAVTNGVAEITATAGAFSASGSITVRQRAAAIDLVATCEGGVICQGLDALGAQLDLTPTVHDSLGQLIAGPEITWTSSDGTIATVDANGRVTAVGNGVVTITATVDGTIRQIAITVQQVVTGISLSTEDIKIKGIGTTFAVSATARDRNGNAVAGAEITWAIVDPQLATVDSTGTITTHAVGSTKLTATSHGFTAKAIITIS